MNNEGFLLLNKPAGITSFDLVKQIKINFRQKIVGHSGTLDKAADGLMILALGKACRVLKYFIGLNKEYEVIAHFGYESDTYDSDGVLVKISEKTVSKEMIEGLISDFFTGKILQIPPKYSALKINGMRASDIIREGGDIDFKPRNVEVFSFEILEFDFPYVSFRVSCSSGTYVRSLINDLGKKLGIGAYVKNLKRTRVGPYSINECSKNIVTISDFVRKMPFVELDKSLFLGLENGKRLSSQVFSIDKSEVFAFYENNCVGVLEKSENASIKLKKAVIK